MAEQPVFGDYFSAGLGLDSGFGSAALRFASRLAASRLPIRRMAVQASTLLLRGRAFPLLPVVDRHRRGAEELAVVLGRQPKALAMRFQRFAGEWTLRRRLGGSGRHTGLLRCPSTWRRVTARLLRRCGGPGRRGAQRCKAVLKRLHLAFQRGDVACASHRRLVRGRCLSAHLPSRERADLFLQCGCKTGHESGRLLGPRPLNACRKAPTL